MAKNIRTSRPGMSFVTIATRDRKPTFETSRLAELFIDTLLHYRTLGHYKLHAYVVMPDRVYLLITPQSIALEHAVELIKNGFAYRLNTDTPIWQHGYTDHSVANLSSLEKVRAYLHQLPVEAKLCASAEMYPHSSAYRRASLAELVSSGSAG